MYQLSNDVLQISIKPIGAELYEISSVKNGQQFMWHGDSNVWSGIAPNLFPIVGCLKNDEYVFNKKTYKMPKHGFLRKSEQIKFLRQSENSIAFSLVYNEDLLKLYPFKFELIISYTLENNTLHINHKVKNLDSQSIYFSIGGHPAFKCPVYKDEKYSDYSLIFETNETAETYLLNKENFLLTDKTRPALSTKNSINLRPDLFKDDALIFKDLKSRKVSLISKTNGELLNITFKDFNYLGVWAKPNAPYVCIEPWLGIADHENTTQELTKKEAIIKLEREKEFNATYSIQIHERHLE